MFRKPASTFAIRTSQRTNQKLQKSLLCQRRQKLFLKKFPTLQIKIKIHRHTARQTQQTMTRELNIDKCYNDTVDRRPAGNSVLPQLAVTCKIEAECSYQTFVQVDSVVLRNRQLRQHANRCTSPARISHRKLPGKIKFLHLETFTTFV